LKTALIFAFVVCAQAQSGPGLPFFQSTTFGMFGLAKNQAARLNVLNPGTSLSVGKPFCSAELAFRDSDGHVLKTMTATVEEEKAVALEIDRAQISNGSDRVQIRATFRTAAVGSGPPAISPIMPGSVCSLYPTLEIYDKDTGKTTLIMSEGRTSFVPTPTTGVRLPPRRQ
jgi:hypothetical protein